MSLLQKVLRPARVLLNFRCYATQHEPIDEPIDEQFHFIPMGQSDVSMQTRVSFLSKDMNQENLVGIRTISTAGFRLMDGQFMFGPIAVFPKTVLSWRVPSIDHITPESLELFLLLQPKLDLFVLGVGDHSNVDKVRKIVVPTLVKNQIPFEILSTEFAIPTFNYINSEKRYVAAALFPPEDIIISRYQYGKALNIVRDYFEGEFNPLLMGLNDTGDSVDDSVRRLYQTSPPEECEAALKRVREIRALHRERRLKYHEERRETVEPARLEDSLQVRKRWDALLAERKKEDNKLNDC